MKQPTPLQLQYTPAKGANIFLIMADYVNDNNVPQDTIPKDLEFKGMQGFSELAGCFYSKNLNVALWSKPPTQKGDEYYIQEEFRVGAWHENVKMITLKSPSLKNNPPIKQVMCKIAYDYKTDPQGKFVEHGNLSHYLDLIKKCKQELVDKKYPQNEDGSYVWEKFSSPLDWQPASEMTYEQSRFKGKFDVELKKIQDLTREECKAICGYADYKALYNFVYENTGEYIDSSNNPYVWLISKGSKDE